MQAGKVRSCLILGLLFVVFAVSAASIWLVIGAALAVADVSQVTASDKSYGTLQATPIASPYSISRPVTATVAPSNTPTNTPACGLAWRRVPSANVESASDLFSSVAVISANDIWAVGLSYVGPVEALAEHWDGTQWSIEPSADPGPYSTLYGVAAISTNDVWAVGWAEYDTDYSQAFSEHWNGTTWAVVPVPVGINDSYLNGIAVISTNDIWAVGFIGSSFYNLTLTTHWDGRQWNVVPSPNPILSYPRLQAVTAVSSKDVWAVGYAQGGPQGQSLVEHWDGTEWRIVPSPNPSLYWTFLRGVAAISATDVWAVGWSDNEQALTIHWDGTRWSNVPTSYTYELNGVAAISSNDVWAVGNDTNVSASMHWDGQKWSATTIFNTSILSGAAAVNGNMVWGVGTVSYKYQQRTITMLYSDPCIVLTSTPSEAPASTAVSSSTATTSTSTSTNAPAFTETPFATASTAMPATSTPSTTFTTEPTAMPSNTQTTPILTTPTSTGTSGPCDYWAVLVRPSMGTSDNELDGVAVLSSSDVWAVGDYAYGTVPQTLLERHGQCVTPAPTATVCPIQFSDVPTSSTFYPYIQCLACRGVISGYPEGTFMPNTNVTRGQLSKIVSNSAGFNNLQTTQIFQDVPVGSTFFQFIGRLASRGYIGGYACGGNGEACVPPAYLPYFRPGNNAIRGQISKIDANAARYSDTPTGQQFEDIGMGSIYYTYTYRLVSHSVIRGYPCGGLRKPCVPPANLPYFRPNDNATRGQTSKIVAKTYFPDCQTLSKR